ncbi:MAG: DUF6607 family protein [Pseudomonadota bacterium]
MTFQERYLLVILMSSLVLPTKAFSDEEQAQPEVRQYTYAWQFTDDDEMRPRGGTTKGPDIKLDKMVSPAWQVLQEEGLSKLEKDRRAILAMAGPYRTSFDFIETVGFAENYQPARPYQSWGAEYVYVVADEPEFISLQHIIVTFIKQDDGELMGPIIVKHWRHDWRYQDRDLHVYAGHRTWQRKTLSEEDAQGTWSQAVFQVDDSPRYEIVGKWQHEGNHSSWQSESTWRPLPRREFSVRKDYHTLDGTHRITITPTGWVQEQDNLKLVLTDAGEPVADNPYLAREAGLNRYERIADYDFSAGDTYWQKTGPFWADVRMAWEDVYKNNKRFTLQSKVDDQLLFMAMFGYAAELEKEGAVYDAKKGRAFADETLKKFLKK